MPIQRFRRIEDMPPPPALPALHPDNLRIAFEWSVAVMRFTKVVRVPGVYRRDLRDIEATAAPLAEVAISIDEPVVPR